MSDKNLAKTVFMALFVLLAMPHVHADEAALSPGQQFFFETVAGRRSVRSFKSDMVSDAHLLMILDAARMAASSGNQQPWKFVVVTDPRMISELAEAASARILGMNSFVGQAKVLIVIVRERPNFSSKVGGTVKSKDYSHIDIGIATENICLQAIAEGIGSCILGWFDEKQVRSILKIPASKRVELIVTLGYSLSEYREKKRKPKEVTVSYNKY